MIGSLLALLLARFIALVYHFREPRYYRNLGLNITYLFRAENHDGTALSFSSSPSL
jgi:hypothetical protein